ncbi:MAG: hypothetical protein Q4E24_16605 [bacterium]|nr:hypothetical protein [bacterium]
MRERIESIFDNLLVQFICFICTIAFFVGMYLSANKTKSLNDALDAYFVKEGIIDSSVLESKDLEEQIRIIAEAVMKQKNEKDAVISQTVSQLSSLLLTIGYDSDTVDSMSEAEMLDTLSSYLESMEDDAKALALQYAEFQQDYVGLQEDYDELSSKTMAELSAPSLVINGESIDTTLKDYVAVINGKNYYMESLLNSCILDEQLSVKDDTLYYAETASERVKAVTDALLHDNADGRFEIQKESSDYLIGTKSCTYGLVNKQWGSGGATICIECEGKYSTMEFGIGHVNDSGRGDKTLNIYYRNTDGDYVLTYTKKLNGDMAYEDVSVDIFNTSTVKIEYLGSYGSVRYGMTDIYLVK